MSHPQLRRIRLHRSALEKTHKILGNTSSDCEQNAPPWPLQRPKLEKRIQKIRKALRERFRIRADPIRHIRIAVPMCSLPLDQWRPDKPLHETERKDPSLRRRGVAGETRLYRAQFRILMRSILQILGQPKSCPCFSTNLILTSGA